MRDSVRLRRAFVAEEGEKPPMTLRNTHSVPRFNSSRSLDFQRLALRTKHLFKLGACLLLLFASACGKPAKAREGQSSGAEIYARRCSACHGVEGHGMAAVGAPAVAGLQSWYVSAQLQKFRAGHRGLESSDLDGMRMRPMALGLSGEADIKAVSEFIGFTQKRKFSPVATIEGGDPQRGLTLFAACTACHGFLGEGNETMKAPALAGTDDWYLHRQLNNFRSGIRGSNPKDVTGGQMRPMAQALADDQAVKDVVAYIQTLPAYN